MAPALPAPTSDELTGPSRPSGGVALLALAHLPARVAPPSGPVSGGASAGAVMLPLASGTRIGSISHVPGRARGHRSVWKMRLGGQQLTFTQLAPPR